MEGISYLNPERPTITKAPSADLVYGFRWLEWLAQEGTSIATATVEIVSGDAVVASVAHADGIVSCKISGGTAGTEAVATCTITTAGVPAQTEQRSLWITIGLR